MEIDAHLIEMLPALVIVVGAAVIVGMGIHVGQRLERRSDSARSALANERLAGPDECADLRPGRAADEEAVRDICRDAALLVMDDGDTPAIIAPWRAATGRDSDETTGRPVASARGWSREESDDIVELYRTGFELDEVAADLDVTSSAVVEELARRAFGAMDPVADPRARRFGQRWTLAELRILNSASRAGFGVADIAISSRSSSASSRLRPMRACCAVTSGPRQRGTSERRPPTSSARAR